MSSKYCYKSSHFLVAMKFILWQLQFSEIHVSPAIGMPKSFIAVTLLTPRSFFPVN